MGRVVQTSQEALEGLGELEVAVVVEKFGVEGVDGGLESVLFGPEVGHAAA
ncbi:hypothetical protein D3C83_52450 [compost metagenome]